MNFKEIIGETTDYDKKVFLTQSGMQRLISEHIKTRQRRRNMPLKWHTGG